MTPELLVAAGAAGVAAALATAPAPARRLTALRLPGSGLRLGRLGGTTRRTSPALVVAGTAGAVLVLAGPALAAAVGAVTVVLLRRAARARSRRTSGQARTDATRACAAVAADLRAGLPVAEALLGGAAAVPTEGRSSGPAAGGGVRQSLAEAGRLALLGGAPGAPLVAARLPELRDLGTALAVAARTGAPASQVVDRLARTAREDLQARQEAEASLAGARATTAVLGALPLAGVGLGSLVGADPLGVLLTGSLGAVLLLSGTALSLVALLWGDRIVDAAAPP